MCRRIDWPRTENAIVREQSIASFLRTSQKRNQIQRAVPVDRGMVLSCRRQIPALSSRLPVLHKSRRTWASGFGVVMSEL
jgi:hypothetical protein